MRSFAVAVLVLIGWVPGGWVAVPAAQAQQPVRGGILPFALAAEPPTYDCHQANTFAVVQRVSPHYSSLLKFADGKYPEVAGDVAASWTVSPDQLT